MGFNGDGSPKSDTGVVPTSGNIGTHQHGLEQKAGREASRLFIANRTDLA